ncbi:MAG TPA: ABC transporter permease [Thermomicrobiales bacterium]|nr:ABC transporter permease [Thermomicrobiales bacterium]
MSTAERTTEASATDVRGRTHRDTLEVRGKPRTYLGMARRRFQRNKMAMAGLLVFVTMVVIALGAGLISQYITGFEPQRQNLRAQFTSVGQDGYILGADEFGRDILTRLAYGARVSLGVAGLSVVVALVIGTAIGTSAGYFGRWVDSVMMRFVDVMLSIPTLFLLLLVASMWRLGPVRLAFVIAAVAWVTLSRLVRGEVMSVKGRDYVEAARVVGANNLRIMTRHILPNVTPVIIVWGSLIVPGLILLEATLSFLGLGVQPPTASWGNMLTQAQRNWSHSWLLVFLPGFAIYITVFAINLVGSGLRDALDPRLGDR